MFLEAWFCFVSDNVNYVLLLHDSKTYVHQVNPQVNLPNKTSRAYCNNCKIQVD